MLCMAALVLSVFSACSRSDGGAASASDPQDPAASEQTPDSAPDSAPEPQSGEDKTITVWHSFTQENRAAHFEEMTEKYTQEHPNVNFEIEIYPWNTFDTKWKTGLSANALPDFSTALPEHVAMMAEADVLSPLNGMIEEMGNPFVQKPVDILTVNGNTMAVPYYVHARVLWYRKAILDKLELNPPATLDELAAVTTAVAQDGELYGMAVPMSKKDFFGTIYLYITAKSMGGYMITEDGRANLTSPEMIDAINYLVDIYQNASPEGSINYGDSEQADAFIQGQTAFYYETGFTIGRIISGNPDIADDFAALPPPVPAAGDMPGWFADYVTFAVWKGDAEAEAKNFLKTMYNQEDYVKFLHLVPGGMIPSIKGVAESAEFLSNETIATHKDDIALIAEGVANGCPLGADFGLVPAMNVVKTQGIVEEMLQQVAMGTASAEDAAKAAEDKLNAEIDRIGQ